MWTSVDPTSNQVVGGSNPSWRTPSLKNTRSQASLSPEPVADPTRLAAGSGRSRFLVEKRIHVGKPVDRDCNDSEICHHVDFMVKDSKRFADSGGWGYAELALFNAASP
jgi:hypothetical protein